MTTPVIDEADDDSDLLGAGEGLGIGLGDCEGDGEGLGTGLGECEGDGDGVGAVSVSTVVA